MSDRCTRGKWSPEEQGDMLQGMQRVVEESMAVSTGSVSDLRDCRLYHQAAAIAAGSQESREHSDQGKGSFHERARRASIRMPSRFTRSAESAVHRMITALAGCSATRTTDLRHARQWLALTPFVTVMSPDLCV